MKKRHAKSFADSFGRGQIDFSKVGKHLGDGADGNVYQYGKEKVIKFCSDFECWEDIRKILGLIRNFKAFPKIYSSGGIAEPEAVWNGMYWVVMEKLPRKIRSVKERDTYDMFYDIVSDKEWSAVKALPVSWQTTARSLMIFEEKHSYYHDDLHRDNIMLTKDGRPKIIDLESFV